MDHIWVHIIADYQMWLTNMGNRGSRPEAQFTYWDLRRRGKTQSDIARTFDISRQAVNKSMKLAERDLLFRLLDTAQMSGILVEWQDARKGVLIGITPQLGNLGCLMVVDPENNIRMFYDQDGNKDKGSRNKLMKEMDEVMEKALGIRVNNKDTFRDILKKIIRGDIE
jgi:hypothetical protein